LGSKQLRELVSEDKYLEAFIHTQLAVEKLLWDRIIGTLDAPKASNASAIMENERKKDRFPIGTWVLILWAHILGAIDEREFEILVDFNSKRNAVVHGHGRWWNVSVYSKSLDNAIAFVEKSGM